MSRRVLVVAGQACNREEVQLELERGRPDVEEWARSTYP
jgi:hypothetical protein